MSLFDVEFRKDLVEINKRLQYEKNIDIRNSLLEDKDYILQYLGYKQISKTNYKKMLKKEDAIEFLKNSNLRCFYLKKFKIFYINHKKLSLLTEKFIEEPKNKLYNTYKQILNYNGMKFVNSCLYRGKTIYIKSLDKNYIEILKNYSINDYLTKIHELGHARVNNISKATKLKFVESYPIFLELVFSDFLKENGYVKEAFNIKLSLLNQLKDFLEQSQEELYSYLNRSDAFEFDNFIFEYKYKVLRDIILAFHIYEMYVSKSYETSKKIDYFILNLSKLTEEQLLNIFGIDILEFNKSTKFLEKIYSDLKLEKKSIKKANRIIKK